MDGRVDLPSTGILEECVPIIIYRIEKVEFRYDTQSKGTSRTIKVLSVKLLYKLQHHSVDGTAPHGISRGETFEPGCLSALVLRLDSRIELFDNLNDQGVVLRNIV